MKHNSRQINVCFALTLATTLCCTQANGQNKFINPTGTFEYVGAIVVRSGDAYGYSGTIQVKALSTNKIVMTFFLCKGATSYNIGSFIDTLDYINSVAVHKDKDCRTNFTFTNSGIKVTETSTTNCWGNGVYAHGQFRKRSSLQPILVDPLSGEKLR